MSQSKRVLFTAFISFYFVLYTFIRNLLHGVSMTTRKPKISLYMKACSYMAIMFSNLSITKISWDLLNPRE